MVRLMRAQGWDRNAPAPLPEPIELRLQGRQEARLSVLVRIALFVGYLLAAVAYVVGTPLSWFAAPWPGRRTSPAKPNSGPR